MMPILVKSDDVRSGRKARLVTAGYGQHGSQWVKEPTHVLKRVGHMVPGVVVWRSPLRLVLYIGLTLLHLTPLDRIVQEK